MCEGIPRRLIDELVMRWQLTGERLLMVEGTDDRRFFSLLVAEGHCDSALTSLAIFPSDAVEIPLELVDRHGGTGSGAKQRVIAFAREIERAAACDGFRGVVDQDLDRFLARDHRSEALLYTDHGCMEAYLWSLHTLRRLLIQFRCEARVPSPKGLRALYDSIGSVCGGLAAVRVAALRHPEWLLEIHRSTKALSVDAAEAHLDLVEYVRQAKHSKDPAAVISAEVTRAHADVGGYSALDIINGHDLLWVVQFVLRELSTLPRRVIDEAAVAGALLSVGVMDPALPGRPLFARLTAWAAA